jgi:hypothetical protein
MVQSLHAGHVLRPDQGQDLGKYVKLFWLEKKNDSLIKDRSIGRSVIAATKVRETMWGQTAKQ